MMALVPPIDAVFGELALEADGLVNFYRVIIGVGAHHEVVDGA